MRKGRGIAFNTLLNTTTAPLLAVGQLALTTVLAERLSLTTFGTWSFLLGFTFFQGYGGILDLGFSTSAMRSIVRAANDEESASRVLRIFRTIYLRVSCAGLMVVVCLLPISLRLVGISMDLSTVLIVVGSFAALIPIDMFHSANLIALESQRRFPAIRVLQLVGLYSWLAILSAALLVGSSLSMIAFLFVMQSILLMAVSTVLVRSSSAVQFARGSLIRTDEARSMISVGKWMTVVQILLIFQSQMDRTVIALTLGVDEVGRYQIPFKLYAFGLLLLQQFSSAVAPAAAHFQFERAADRTKELFQRGTRVGLTFLLPVFIGVGIYSQELIRLWVGDEFAGTYRTAQVFMVYLIVLAFNYLGVAMIAAHGKARSLVVLYSISIPVNLAVSLILVHHFGISGVVFGSIAGSGILLFPLFLLEREEFGIDLRSWTSEILVPAVAVTVWTVLGGLIVWRITGGDRSAINAIIGVMLVVGWGWAGAQFLPAVREDVRVIFRSLAGR